MNVFEKSSAISYVEILWPGWVVINLSHSELFLFFKGPKKHRSSCCRRYAVCSAGNTTSPHNFPSPWPFQLQREFYCWHHWPSTNKITLWALVGFTNAMKCSSHCTKRSEVTQPFTLTSPTVPGGLPLSKSWFILRRLKIIIGGT